MINNRKSKDLDLFYTDLSLFYHFDNVYFRQFWMKIFLVKLEIFVPFPIQWINP